MLGSVEAIHAAVNGGRVWWIAPTYSQAQEGWNLIKFLGSQAEGDVRESDREITFPGGGSVQAKTADNPNRLRGAGLDFAILDECRDMKAETWYHVIRPALADRKGRALFISSPNGFDWFYDLWRKGEDGIDGWASFQLPTAANPHLSASEVEDLAADLPEFIRRQEVLAEFLDAEGLVFRNVRPCANAVPAPGGTGGHFIFADLASTTDFNAVAVVRRDGPRLVQVHVDRWTRVPVNVTLERLRAVAAKYPGVRSLDATGLGGDFAHQWAGRSWGGTKFTADLKADMVNNLIALFEHERISILNPDCGDAAKAQYYELLAYRAERMPSGTLRYSAPGGKHDDTVVALMGACWLAKEHGGIRLSADPRVRDMAL